ncbi:MAG TPA: transposase [Candidatus Angelobacter sp.]|nr:transposase [Candidatus Angelobacter sp.]
MRKAPQEKRTFFVTSVAHFREPLFKHENLARLLLDVLYENRKLARFHLHEFVIMPHHFHLILTPAPGKSLERALQYIKGGYSFRVKRELGFRGLPWEEGFKNHRIRDYEDYQTHREYIHQNPVEAGLVNTPADILILRRTQALNSTPAHLG